MLELTINNTVYEFNFGFGFLKDINTIAAMPVKDIPGMKKNVGLAYAVASILDGDIEILVEVLDKANKGRNPRITRTDIENYIDDVNTDIDGLFEDVINFLEKSNCCRKTVQPLKAEKERQLKAQEEKSTS